MPLGVDDLLVGAAVGAAASELLKAILDAKDKTSSFKSSMDTLKSTLETIIPKIEKIKLLDRGLNTDIDNLISELKKGKDLVCKCSTINRFNIFQKFRYAKKLEKLDVSLRGIFSLKVNVEIWSDTKQIWAHLQETSGVSGKMDPNECRCAVPEIPNFFVGMDVRIKELKTELFKDGVSIIGLCALGGSGKTTLAAKLCQDEEVKERFKDKILFLTVSSSPNLKVIVNGLFVRLGSGKEDINFQNDEEAVKYLGGLMKQKDPILLVLDDVWSESFLQKFVFENVGHKILVTSRTQYKLFDFTYSLKMLSDSDSMSLFRYLAFPQDGSCEIPDEDCVKEIVSGCKGLPLTLKVIACSLRGEPVRKWRSTESKLRKGSSIFNTHKELLECLASSLDFLDDDLQDCFFDLGLFSEDQRVPASVLIDIWVEFYKLNEDEAYVNLLELSRRNLINLQDESVGKDAGKIDGNFNELFVTQHDILRDLAIYKNQDRQNINQRHDILRDLAIYKNQDRQNINQRLMMDLREDNSKQDHQPFDASLVSIHAGRMHSSGWSNMKFPKAEVMLLSFSKSDNILPQFIKKMSNLKVLIISSCGTTSLNLPSFCVLSQLKRLRMEQVELVFPEGSEGIMFPSLDKISLKWCIVRCNSPVCHMFSISSILRNGCLYNHSPVCNISSICPNLTEIDISFSSLRKVFLESICKIRRLKKLSFNFCGSFIELPEQIGDLTELEVLRLRGSMYLTRLPDSIQILSKLRFLDISCCNVLESMPEGIGALCSLKKLDMRDCRKLKQLPKSAMDLRHLKEVSCDEEMGMLWKTLVMRLPDLNIQVGY